jgi:hypothetical protein
MIAMSFEVNQSQNLRASLSVIKFVTYFSRIFFVLALMSSGS